jgi:hypothetical protein
LGRWLLIQGLLQKLPVTRYVFDSSENPGYNEQQRVRHKEVFSFACQRVPE